MRSWLLAAVAAIIVIGLIAAGLIFFVFWDQFVPIAAMGINYVRYMNAPAGTIATEADPAWKEAAATAGAISAKGQPCWQTVGIADGLSAGAAADPPWPAPEEQAAASAMTSLACGRLALGSPLSTRAAAWVRAAIC